MPNLRDIKRRIKSVKNTQQITRAMKFVAAAKLQKAQARVFGARPYARSMLAVINRLVCQREAVPSHPLMRDTGDERIMLVVITGDKGLCGAFNANIIRSAAGFVRERGERPTTLEMIGKKGVEFFRHRRYDIRSCYVDELSRIDMDLARKVSAPVLEDFLNGECDRVYVMYNEFKSVIQQRITVEQLLPIVPLETEEYGEPASAGYLFDQPAGDVCEDIFSRHAVVQLYHAMLESAAAEQGARMTAMESATKNAGEMIGNLVMFRNRVRQAAITTEIIEIVSGANAL